MKAERSCGGSLIEPRGHSLALHQHPALLKQRWAAGGGCRGRGGDRGTSGSFVGAAAEREAARLRLVDNLRESCNSKQCLKKWNTEVRTQGFLGTEAVASM